MATQLTLRRGTTAQHSTFTGAAGEITVDTDKKTVVVHDGVTAGGKPLLKAEQVSAFGLTLIDDPDAATARATLGAYGKNNIVGTVSQSGGVPTGAVIEQGTNTNGYYICFADGTMICWYQGSTPWEQPLSTSKSVHVLFPRAFVTADISLQFTPLRAAAGGSMNRPGFRGGWLV